jgi:O-antigen/teichoic acid export membrane protein
VNDNATGLAATASRPPALTLPSDNVGRNVFKNSVAQVVGRVGVALLRLVIAGILLRAYGKELFGQYSLLFGVLTIADWLVDFGTTDVFVRELCRTPEDSTRLLRILTAAKLFQGPAGFAALAMILFALRYPADVTQAGIIGGINLFFFAGVLIFRVIFRATLTTEREAVAELISVAAMVPLVAVTARLGGALPALFVCHVLSRGIFFGACFVMGRNKFQLSVSGVTARDVLDSLRSSAAIGAIGFLVGGYETLDVVILSKVASLSDLAYFSGAQRLVWPMLLVLASVAGTFYPVYASFWAHDRRAFHRTCQQALNTIVVLAGLPLSSVLAGAAFYMGLLGSSMVPGSPALRWLAILCLVKAITSTLGPILYVVRAQKSVLKFIGFAVGAKAAAIIFLAPRYGYLGAIAGALGVEIIFAAIPTVYLVRRLAGLRIEWATPVKVVGLIAASALVPRMTLSHDGMAAALASAGMYTGLAFLTRTVHLDQIRLLLGNRR